MKINRREFLAALGLTGASALVGCKCPFGCSKPKIGLQLYSIHKIFWKNPEAILAELAAVGYDGVEFYGYEGRTAKQLKKMCADAGLAPIGTHLNGDIDLVGDALKKTLDFAAEAGFESLVTPHASRKTALEYRAFGRTMGQAAELAEGYGIKVGIHSTYHHFTTKYNGVTAWDEIYAEASPLLYQQIDTGNTFHTGCDLVALLKKYRGRHFSIHAKENTPTIDGVLGVAPTNGNPVVPWREVLSVQAQDPSQEWWIVEAEGRPDSLEPAKKCREVLASWI